MKNLARLMSVTLVIGCTSTFALDQPEYQPDASPAANSQTTPNADNTGMNKRDKDGTEPTPQTQSNASDDRSLLASVRQAVVEEESLSVMAHNIKIMVQDGLVTLRGPVKNTAEKAKIETLAQGVAGVSKVDNQLDIKTP